MSQDRVLTKLLERTDTVLGKVFRGPSLTTSLRAEALALRDCLRAYQLEQKRKEAETKEGE